LLLRVSSTGLVVALEDATVLWISQKDFTRFVRAFPFLENYFKEYIDETFGGPEESFAPGRPTTSTSSRLRLSIGAHCRECAVKIRTVPASR
jgi:hypothetical protein